MVERGLTLPAAAINSLRRDVLNQLTALRGRVEVRRLPRAGAVPMHTGPRRPKLTVQVTSREQITGKMLKMQPEVLYVPLHILVEDAAFTRDLTSFVRVAAVLPRIVHDGELPRIRKDMESVRVLGVAEVLVGNLGLVSVAMECGMGVRGDHSLNFYNSAALTAARMMELRSTALSFEMTLPQIRDVSKAVPCELLAYGRMPLMVTENCLIKGKTGECSCHLGPVKLMDKTGAEFPVIKDGATCRSVLLNGQKLYMLDRQSDLSKLGIWGMRLYFTTENSKEVDRILGACVNPIPFDQGACTRGLYLRGVE